MLIIEMAKREINQRLYWIYGQNIINPRPYWHYAYYKDGQNRINRRPYLIYCTYIDYQTEIGMMLIIEMAKKEITGDHIGFFLFT